jgi:hypothetical protein
MSTASRPSVTMQRSNSLMLTSEQGQIMSVWTQSRDVRWYPKTCHDNGRLLGQRGAITRYEHVQQIGQCPDSRESCAVIAALRGVQ